MSNRSVCERGTIQRYFEWRKISGYDQQSKVENSFYRYKTIIGDDLKSRKENSK